MAKNVIVVVLRPMDVTKIERNFHITSAAGGILGVLAQRRVEGLVRVDIIILAAEMEPAVCDLVVVIIIEEGRVYARINVGGSERVAGARRIVVGAEVAGDGDRTAVSIRVVDIVGRGIAAAAVHSSLPLLEVVVSCGNSRKSDGRVLHNRLRRSRIHGSQAIGICHYNAVGRFGSGADCQRCVSIGNCKGARIIGAIK